MNVNEELLRFLEKSPDCFHATDNFRQILKAEGYTELKEGEAWRLQEGKYFTVRNESSLIAFRIPKQDFRGFMIGASHSDSPTFKIKDNPEMESNGYIRLNTEKYGGMLMNPWFDRPLSVSGRVIVKEGNTFVTKLVNVDRDLLVIPHLAIHMDRGVNDGRPLNAQSDTLPVLGDASAKGTFMKIVAEAAGVKEKDILGHDLFLYRRGPGSIWGAHNEFLSSGRLDDLQCGFGDLYGFLQAEKSESVPVFAVFDNEEVGSTTKQGANSTFLYDVLRRIALSCGKDEEDFRQAIASSFMVSADNAHAVHPNYADKADPVNRPHMNEGIVIKYSANQKYTTDGISAAVFRDICKEADVPVQVFTNRSDVLGGGTLGNISNTHISLNTVDIGLPQLAMHSPFETAGTKDTEYLIRAMKVFYSSSLADEGQGNYRIERGEVR